MTVRNPLGTLRDATQTHILSAGEGCLDADSSTRTRRDGRSTCPFPARRGGAEAVESTAENAAGTSAGSATEPGSETVGTEP